MAKTIKIICRHPHGFILRLAGMPDVTINGQNKDPVLTRSPIPVITTDSYGVTDVDADFWEAWKAAHIDHFIPLKNGMLTEAKSESDVIKVAAELVNEKTGFEGAKPEGKVEAGTVG